MLYIGIIFLLTPFLTVFLFKNKYAGFLLVLSGWTAYIGIISFLLSYFHIFNKYSVSFFVILLAAVALGLTIFKFKKNSLSFEMSAVFPLVLFVLAFSIVSYELYSVHFNYTGMVSTIQGNAYVEKSNYPYPMFSDEYVAVGYMNSIIKTGSFPFYNIFAPDRVFYNFTPLFFSFLSYISMWLSVSPLVFYSWAAVVFGCLFCFTVYASLRSLGVNQLGAVVSILFIPFVINAANLPGIWFLIPYNISLILLVAYIGVRENFGVFYGGVVAVWAVIFYPPIVIFFVPVLIYEMFQNKDLLLNLLLSKFRSRLHIFALLVMLAVLLVLASYLSSIPIVRNILNSGFTHVLRDPDLSYKENFLPWTVIPIYVFPAIFTAFIYSLINFQKKYLNLLLVTFAGMSVWAIVYAFQYQVVIGHPRVATITAYLLVMFSGIGFGKLYDKLTKQNLPTILKNENLYVFFILICFILPALNYTKFETWKDTYIVDYGKVAEFYKIDIEKARSLKVVFPSPVNRYLMTDDLEIFSAVREQVFISHIWKSLVIASATGNYPLQTKKSIISVNQLDTNEFIQSSCDRKNEIASDYNVIYVYLPEFSCEGFVPVYKSMEGFILYTRYKIEPN